MNNFSSYAKLSPSYRAFVTNLSKIQIQVIYMRHLTDQNGRQLRMKKSEPWRRMAPGYYQTYRLEKIRSVVSGYLLLNTKQIAV